MLHVGRRLALLGMLVMVMATIGCGGDDDSTAPVDITGTWTLRTVDGDPPPYTLFDESGWKREILSGSVTLNADGTYRDAFELRDVGSNTTSSQIATSSGTYARTGNALTLGSALGDPQEPATIHNGTLLYTLDFEDGSQPIVFRFTQ